MSALPRVGLLLKGYCNGYFGRDSYGDKRIEAIGADWVVVRVDDGEPDFAAFENPTDMNDILMTWAEGEEKMPVQPF